MKYGVIAMLCTALFVPRTARSLTWTRVEELPATDTESVELHGTTLYAAGVDTVYRGAAFGSIWSPSEALGAGGAPILATIPAGGSLWAGTFGQGVFRATSESGSGWSSFNTGLTGLGSNHVVSFEVRDDTLFAATEGAGVFALDLATGTQWTEFNNGLPVFTAGSVSSIVLNGTTLVAPAGPNGLVYRLPQGAAVWEEIAVRPPLLPGFVATDIYSDGSNVLVTNGSSLYRSTDDAESWSLAGSGLASGSAMFLAKGGSTFYAVVDFLNNTHQFYSSTDDGESWQPMEDVTNGIVYEIEVAGDKLFAGRTDGLWWIVPPATPVHPTTWGQIKARFGR
jgi:hypothetical protein